jgi:hypothetical protein
VRLTAQPPRFGGQKPSAAPAHFRGSWTFGLKPENSWLSLYGNSINEFEEFLGQTKRTSTDANNRAPVSEQGDFAKPGKTTQAMPLP